MLLSGLEEKIHSSLLLVFFVQILQFYTCIESTDLEFRGKSAEAAEST